MLTREMVISDPSTHKLTKDVLALAEDKDCVDAYYDVQLALLVLKAEMERAFGRLKGIVKF